MRGYLLTKTQVLYMPSTAAGAIVGAAGGGIIGGILGDFDIGVITGALIGSTVAVIASKDNNKTKALVFVCSLAAGIPVSEPAEKILNDITGYDISRLVSAILVSALFVPILLVLSNRENIKKGVKLVLHTVSDKLDLMIGALEKWRGKNDSSTL
ncbi:hypothetical protein J4731_19290 [Providencia rettgeri]|nr:hypothetical protein [Providencia rettgeri]